MIKALLLSALIGACFVSGIWSMKSLIKQKTATDEDLFPVYECDKRSRNWTLRCLVPLTNFQLSLDLCRTNEKPDKAHVHRCAQELKALGKSCPQTASVADMANNMILHSPPPPLPDSPNAPKVPKKARKQTKGYEKDKLSL
ncbi:uncharacterized protein LOC128268429 [Anopheles cruzii]|uniref:uncharacterized protein LOC128268429 n=1 Tax=Anopheles cruzii TaxID=68878 RepID=UPI0022EC1ABB|nr:uncharacterized protein LOC128268429 [Anopheles cruzii]